VITPNVFEARTLAGMASIDSVAALAEAARRIHAHGPAYVVAKGGVELPGEDAVDVLFDGERTLAFASPKVGDERVSGAGCTFAAAVTAELAKGASVTDAVHTAKGVVSRAIRDRIEPHTPFD